MVHLRKTQTFLPKAFFETWDDYYGVTLQDEPKWSENDGWKQIQAMRFSGRGKWRFCTDVTMLMECIRNSDAVIKKNRFRIIWEYKDFEEGFREFYSTKQVIRHEAGQNAKGSTVTEVHHYDLKLTASNLIQ